MSYTKVVGIHQREISALAKTVLELEVKKSEMETRLRQLDIDQSQIIQRAMVAVASLFEERERLIREREVIDQVLYSLLREKMEDA